MSVLVESNAHLDRVLPALETADEIALDTEFHPERSYRPRLMLLQLCVSGGEPVVVDVLGSVSLPRLALALERARVVVHGGAADLQLVREHVGIRPTRLADTQLVAAFAGLGWPRRLQELVDGVLGVHLSKGSTLSDWSRRPLTAEQLAYAVSDVTLLAMLEARLRERVRALGNEGWLAEAEAEQLATAGDPPDPQQAWRRVPGAHLLDAPGRRALHALARWREERASARDLPVKHVVSDAVLLDLARRRPGSVAEMRENRRMPSAVWKVDGPELVALLEDEAPAPPRALPRGLRVDAIRLAARAAAAARGLDGDLLMPDSEVEYILDGSSTPRWRRSALGLEFEEFLSGRRFLDASGTFRERGR
jgi:ribonuclease D